MMCGGMTDRVGVSLIIFEETGSDFNLQPAHIILIVQHYIVTWGLLLIPHAQSMMVLLWGPMSHSPPASSMQSS